MWHSDQSSSVISESSVKALRPKFPKCSSGCFVPLCTTRAELGAELPHPLEQVVRLLPQMAERPLGTCETGAHGLRCPLGSDECSRRAFAFVAFARERCARHRGARRILEVLNEDPLPIGLLTQRSNARCPRSCCLLFFGELALGFRKLSPERVTFHGSQLRLLLNLRHALAELL